MVNITYIIIPRGNKNLLYYPSSPSTFSSIRSSHLEILDPRKSSPPVDKEVTRVTASAQVVIQLAVRVTSSGELVKIRRANFFKEGKNRPSRFAYSFSLVPFLSQISMSKSTHNSSRVSLKWETVSRYKQ